MAKHFKTYFESHGLKINITKSQEWTKLVTMLVNSVPQDVDGQPKQEEAGAVLHDASR